MKLIFRASLIFLFLYWMYLVFFKDSSTAPVFHNQGKTWSLVEALAEPASFTYGSSIDVWFYQDSLQQTKEISITGHADSRTCGQMSALVFNTYLQKLEHEADFFIAGAGRLVHQIDENRFNELEALESIQSYKEIRDQKKFIQRFIEVLKDPKAGIYSKTSKSPLKIYADKLDEIEKVLLQLEQNDEVQEYKNQISAIEAFDSFSKESYKYAKNTGLVRTHLLPAEIIHEVKQKIHNALQSNENDIISFTDLLENHGIDEAVVWVEMLDLKEGNSLNIKIPIEDLSKESFAKAKAENRNEVEIAMVGDAQRRMDFFSNQITEMKLQQEHYEQLPNHQRKKIIQLDKCISPEGVLFDCEGSYVTINEYLTERIPRIIIYLRENIESLESIIKELEEDKVLIHDSKIENINHMTLIDAMLRDWSLPVGRSQKAFEKWCLEEREKTWKKIKKELKKKDIPVSALEGENIVFSIKTDGKYLTITPMQMLDLSNSILVLDRKLNVIRVESTWNHREVNAVSRKERVDAEDFNPLTFKKKVMTLSSTKDLQELEKYLMWNLNIFPRETLVELEKIYNSSSKQFRSFSDTQVNEITPVVKAKQVLSKIAAIYQNPENENNPLSYLKEIYGYLQSYPEAPVDIHLRFIIELAGIVAYVNNNPSFFNRRMANDLFTTLIERRKLLDLLDARNSGLSPNENLAKLLDYLDNLEKEDDELPIDSISTWEILDLAESDLDSLKQKCQLTEIYFDVDFSFFDEIVDRIKLVKARESSYYFRAKAAENISDEISEEFQAFLEKTEEISAFQSDALYYLTTLQNLINYNRGEDAAFELLINEESLVNSYEKLKLATKNDLTGRNLLYWGASSKIKRHIENGIPFDDLSRNEAYHLVKEGGKSILRELKHLHFDYTNKAVYGYDQIFARYLFESGDYGLAIDHLMDSLTSIIAYHDRLTWEVLKGDWIGPPFPKSLNAVNEGNSITISASRGGINRQILQITGLSNSEAQVLTKKINRLPLEIFEAEGKVSDRVLMAKVPIQTNIQKIFQLTSSQDFKVALLKAMVYEGNPPGSEFVGLPHQNKITLNEKLNERQLSQNIVEEIVVPSIEELIDLYEHSDDKK